MMKGNQTNPEKRQIDLSGIKVLWKLKRENSLQSLCRAGEEDARCRMQAGRRKLQEIWSRPSTGLFLSAPAPRATKFTSSDITTNHSLFVHIHNPDTTLHPFAISQLNSTPTQAAHEAPNQYHPYPSATKPQCRAPSEVDSQTSSPCGTNPNI